MVRILSGHAYLKSYGPPLLGCACTVFSRLVFFRYFLTQSAWTPRSCFTSYTNSSVNDVPKIPSATFILLSSFLFSLPSPWGKGRLTWMFLCLQFQTVFLLLDLVCCQGLPLWFLFDLSSSSPGFVLFFIKISISLQNSSCKSVFNLLILFKLHMYFLVSEYLCNHSFEFFIRHCINLTFFVACY